MILGSRGSPLALTQTRWVMDRLSGAHPGRSFTLEIIRTTGDRQQQSLPESPFGAGGPGDGKGIFVKEIEEAMLEGRIDAAVHSLKDLPSDQPAGLIVAATPAREDPRDAVVTRDGATLESLPAGARVGTSSPRRAAQLMAVRSDLVLLPVRGNVDTRIRKMMEGSFDAVILAAAGLSRLGHLRQGIPGGAVARMIPVEICLPAVGQGALAIEAREADLESRSVLGALHDPVTAAEVESERSFLAALGGGCRVPVAALARCRDGSVHLTGVVASPDGLQLVRVAGQAPIGGADGLGRSLATEALSKGAGAIVRRFTEPGG